MNKKASIAVFASGGGSNAEEIFKYFQNHPEIRVSQLLTNNPQAKALERAKKYNIPTVVFTKDDFVASGNVLKSLSEKNVTHIVLAGFLWLIPEFLIRTFPNKIINIHPALLPKYGGKGMYGAKVHEAVKAAGDLETGITIHLVNSKYDEGKILFQGKCPISETQTPDEIASCVHKLEYEHYPRVIEKWVMNEVGN